MASSSAGSNVFAIISFLLICGAVLLILRHFLPLRSTPAYLTTTIFLALALPTSAILLVPIDLASSQRTEDGVSKGIWLPERAVLVSWRITYWLTFMLTWVALPLLGEYMDSGYRDPKARLVYSLRSNGRYQLIVLTCATLGLIYMVISHGFDFTAIKSLVMALAYIWGLMLAIYLMGHGLVAVPRRMMRNADIAGSLRRVQSHAPRVHEKLEDAVIALEDIETQIRQLQQRKTGTARHFQDWIDDLADTTGQLPGRVTLATPGLSSSVSMPNVVTERYLADLTRRFTRARQQRARYVEEWDHIVQSAMDFQKILDSKISKKLTFGRTATASTFSRTSILTPRLRYHLYVHVIPALRLFLAGVCGLASIAIIQSELIRPFYPQYSIVSLTVIHRPSSESYQVGLGGQTLASVWTMYMVFCALSSMTVIPTWNQRALVHRNTSSESACWYAGQIAKLTVPLAYNFLTFLPNYIQKNTTFYVFLGKLINLTPLGKWIDYVFPMFVLLPVAATLFNLYGRIKDALGFGNLIIEDESDEEQSAFGGGWREGRDLIARDLNGTHAQPHAVGLTSNLHSPRSSVDGSSRGAPTLWIPPAQRASAVSPSRGSNANDSISGGGFASAPRTPRRLTAPLLDPEPEEENFFTLFGRRVKNTFEGIETPKWMQNDEQSSNTNNAGSSGTARRGNNSKPLNFKRPKWLGGDDNGDSNGEGTFIDRLFGNAGSNNNAGREDGRIVL